MKGILKALFPFLCFSLLLAAFPACTSREEKSPLRILMDIPIDPYYISKSRNDIADCLKETIVYSTGGDLKDIEIEVLFTEESERSAQIDALRTEIMSGGGPDVFILGEALPLGKERREYLEPLKSDHPLRQVTDIRERLFQNPEQSMENGAFLPLDSYLEAARYYDSNVIEPAVLAAGQTEEGQMILPLVFTMPTAIYVENPPDRAQAEQCAYGATAWNQFPDLFGELADYKEEKLLFSEEELLQTVKEALSACPAENEPREFDYGKDMRLQFSQKKASGLVSLGSLHAYQLGDWRPDYFSGEWEDGAVPEEISAVSNRDGGVTAQVTAYACINRNTRRPEEAFQVLDLLISREVMGDVLIQKSSNGADDTGVMGASLIYNRTFGIPARNDLLENGETHFTGGRYIGQATGSFEWTGNPETFNIYKDLRAQVTTARFYGELDWELQELFNACREAAAEEEVKALVSRSYDTMKMILAES